MCIYVYIYECIYIFAAAGPAPRRAGRLLKLNSKVVPKAAAFLTVTSTQTG